MTTSSPDFSAATAADIIALLTASYRRPELPVKLVDAPVKGQSKLARIKQEKASQDGSQAAPKSPPLVTIPLPASGTLMARDFLISMRRASDRDSKIRAIAAYCGYDVRETYGSQELTATMKAQREVRGNPVALSMPVHSCLPSVKGYVAGLPSPLETRKADLIAREQVSAAEMAQHLELARTALSEENREWHTGMAKVEEDRIASIRRDLSEMSL